MYVYLREVGINGAIVTVKMHECGDATVIRHFFLLKRS